MINSSERIRRTLLFFVGLSFVFGLGVITFRAGLAATPYDTTDSAGRTMGFNDEFFAEHYLIILGNCSIGNTLGYLGTYEFVLFGAHLAMALLLWRCAARRWVICFGAVQPIVFPWGLMGLLYLPVQVLSAFSSSRDTRESFIDMPYIELMAHPVWLVVCGVIVWKTWRAGRSKSIGE